MKFYEKEILVDLAYLAERVNGAWQGLQDQMDQLDIADLRVVKVSSCHFLFDRWVMLTLWPQLFALKWTIFGEIFFPIWAIHWDLKISFSGHNNNLFQVFVVLWAKKVLEEWLEVPECSAMSASAGFKVFSRYLFE